MDILSPVSPVKGLPTLDFSCKWCGKRVNERFRFEHSENGKTVYEHLYCSVLRSDRLWRTL